VTTLELVVNYKLWDSAASEKFIYDYSGNSRHGRIGHLIPVFTDRGIAPYSGNSEIIAMSFLSTPVEGYSDFAVSFWAFTTANNDFMHIVLVESNGNKLVFQYYSSATEAILVLNSVESLPRYSPILGWNLFTFRLYSDPNNLALRYFDFVLNQ
jgi:hypothetical protein